MSPLLVRTLAAAVFAPLVAGLVWVGGWPLEVGVGTACAVMLNELATLLRLKLKRPLDLAMVAATLAVVAAVLNVGSELAGPVGLALPPVLVLTLALAEPGPPDVVLRRAAAALLAAAWCGATLPCLVVLRRAPEGGRALAMTVLLATWAQDTGAYFAGRWLGRRPLAPRWSPNKTVEGAGGGLWAAIGTALLARPLLGLPLSAVAAAGLGGVVWLFGVLGDLCESMAKRAAGAKDSGRLIPGHGGLFDRLDALLFTAPAALGFWLVLGRLGGGR